MNDWTKLQQEALGPDGMSTLDLPWLGAMRAEEDKWRLLLKYLGGDSRSRVWEDSATKAFVEFQQNPFRVTELSVPNALTVSMGSPQNAFLDVIHSFMSDQEVEILHRVAWEKIVRSAAEKVSDAQGADIDTSSVRNVAAG